VVGCVVPYSVQESAENQLPHALQAGVSSPDDKIALGTSKIYHNGFERYQYLAIPNYNILSLGCCKVLTVVQIPLSKIDGRFSIFTQGAIKHQPTNNFLAGVMDLWTVLLIVAFMAGIMGWTMTPFNSGILWFCTWRDGDDINWGMDVAFTMAVPFAWCFALFEICILYMK
jgi:hypothetical protein